MTLGKFNEKVEILVQSVCSLSKINLKKIAPALFLLISRILSNRVPLLNHVTFYRID